jgi:hypothetical protein
MQVHSQARLCVAARLLHKGLASIRGAHFWLEFILQNGRFF